MAVWSVYLSLHVIALTTPRNWHVKFCMEIIIYMPRNSIFTPAVTNLGMVRSFDIVQFLLASPSPSYEGTQLPEILPRTFFSHSPLLPSPNTQASDAGMFVEPVCRGLATDGSWFYSRRQEIAVFSKRPYPDQPSRLHGGYRNFSSGIEAERSHCGAKVKDVFSSMHLSWCRG